MFSLVAEILFLRRPLDLDTCEVSIDTIFVISFRTFGRLIQDRLERLEPELLRFSIGLTIGGLTTRSVSREATGNVAFPIGTIGIFSNRLDMSNVGGFISRDLFPLGGLSGGRPPDTGDGCFVSVCGGSLVPFALCMDCMRFFRISGFCFAISFKFGIELNIELVR